MPKKFKRIFIKDKSDFLNRIIKKGFTPTLLAKEIFISRQALNYAINGVNGINADTAAKIVEVIKAEFDEIFVIRDFD